MLEIKSRSVANRIIRLSANRKKLEPKRITPPFCSSAETRKLAFRLVWFAGGLGMFLKKRNVIKQYPVCTYLPWAGVIMVAWPIHFATDLFAE